jgi:flagellar hook-length control protein FliK
VLNVGLLGGRAAGGPLTDIGSPVPEPSIVSGVPSLADGGLLVDLFRDLVEALAAPSTPVASRKENVEIENNIAETDDAPEKDTRVICEAAILLTDPWFVAPAPQPIAVDMCVSSQSEPSQASTPAEPAHLDAVATSEEREVRERARPAFGSKPEPVRKPDAPPTAPVDCQRASDKFAPASPVKVEGSPVSQNDIAPAATFEIAEQSQDAESRDSLPVMPGSQQIEAAAIRPGAGFDRRDGDREPSSHRQLTFTASIKRTPATTDKADATATPSGPFVRSSSLHPFVAPAASFAMPGLRVGQYVGVAEAGPAPLSDRTAPEIVQTIRLMWSRGIGEAQIQLDPQQFGDLTVVLKVEGREVAARLQADTPEVRDWLRANQQVFREGLASHDLRLDRLEIAPSTDERRDRSSRDTREHTNDNSRNSRRPSRKQNAGAVFDVVA